MKRQLVAWNASQAIYVAGTMNDTCIGEPSASIYLSCTSFNCLSTSQGLIAQRVINFRHEGDRQEPTCSLSSYIAPAPAAPLKHRQPALESTAPSGESQRASQLQWHPLAEATLTGRGAFYCFPLCSHLAYCYPCSLNLPRFFLCISHLWAPPMKSSLAQPRYTTSLPPDLGYDFRQ